MLKLYIIGLVILIIAILANGIALKLDIKTWYDFFNLIKIEGTKAFNHLTIIDYLWLFIGYPFILGLGYLAGDKLHYFIFG